MGCLPSSPKKMAAVENIKVAPKWKTGCWYNYKDKGYLGYVNEEDPIEPASDLENS